MTIIGIDPGIAIVGYGVIRHEKGRFRTLGYGAVKTPANTEVASRLEIIYDAMAKLIETFSPDDIAVEELFFNTNQKTLIPVSEARGVILLAARQRGLNIGEYTPLQVKLAVVGYGRAEKQQVQAMVKTILGLESVPKPDDTADALAIAICHANQIRNSEFGIRN